MKIKKYLVVSGLMFTVAGSVLLWNSVTKTNLTTRIDDPALQNIYLGVEGSSNSDEVILAALNETKANWGFALQTLGSLILVTEALIALKKS